MEGRFREEESKDTSKQFDDQPANIDPDFEREGMPASALSNVTGISKKRKLSNVAEKDTGEIDRRPTGLETASGADALGADSKP